MLLISVSMLVFCGVTALLCDFGVDLPAAAYVKEGRVIGRKNTRKLSTTNLHFDQL
jgi:hypothetical protein